MFSAEFVVLCFLPVALAASLIIASLALFVIRLLNATWFDEGWQDRRRSPAEQGALSASGGTGRNKT
jgi:uncharacterized membrane protein affecting hemolysin expression